MFITHLGVYSIHHIIGETQPGRTANSDNQVHERSALSITLITPRSELRRIWYLEDSGGLPHHRQKSRPESLEGSEEAIPVLTGLGTTLAYHTFKLINSNIYHIQCKLERLSHMCIYEKIRIWKREKSKWPRRFSRKFYTFNITSNSILNTGTNRKSKANGQYFSVYKEKQ